MNLSQKWLRDYVDIDLPPREYAEGMSLSGSKTEGWTVEGEDIQKVVVGRVAAMERHPDSDHLWICQVETGTGTVQIVTGAQNVREGDFVPAALDGAALPGGKTIRRGKLRGVESSGMLCSLSELGLTAHDFPYAVEDGIFILGEDCDRTLGLNIRTAVGLDDLRFEFEITSNRPDCLSVTGLARETAATWNLPFHLEAPTVRGSGGNVGDYLKVEVHNGKLCPRYMARVVKNVQIEPSPRWMRERLRASGVRPINNIVDITNYVMLEYGQPMHAFDLKYVAGGQIIVRNAQPGEAITTLDEAKRPLSPDMLVIADAKAPSAVAGVMGGQYSGIQADTQTIVFESACFLGSSVRITSKKLGLRTESSGRFEKGLSPDTCPVALARACQLVELLGAGEVVDGVIDVDNADHIPKRIPFTYDWINRLNGVDLPKEEIDGYLARLEIRVEDGCAIPPSYRGDLEHKADLAEEVARLYGYNRLPTTPLVGLAEGTVTPRQHFDRRIHQLLLGQGLSEILTYSFISPKLYDKIALPRDSALRCSVTILNPLGEDTSVMRTTAIPSMLQVLATNYNNRNPQAALYEVAVQYLPKEDRELPEERPAVVLGLYGGDRDFYDLKGMVELLLERLGVRDCRYAAWEQNPTFHPGRCARVTSADGQVLGVLGQVHPQVCQAFGLDADTYLASLDGDLLYACHKDDRRYVPLPKFPASTRDLALTCDEGLPAADLEAVIRQKGGRLLEAVDLFDVYRGTQIAPGKKSVAYALTLRSADHTLTVEECDGVMARILAGLEEIGAQIRK